MSSLQSSLFGNLKRPGSAVLFAGMGGACEGILKATGVSPLVAINHCEHAIRLHKLNHPETLHFAEDVFNVPARKASRGRSIKLLWMSPDCTHFSRAKGKAPKSTGRRSLANVGIDWARDVRPSVIILENVQEFLSWGPLDDEGQPIKERAGEDFREWCQALEAYGYRIEWRILCAADYGSPTSRKRLFIVARCDGKPFVWPKPTHGPGREKPYHTVAECIDWSIPCPSIFLSPEEARKAGVRRPLAPATERRIAQGLRKFVLENPRPYIVQTGHQSGDSGKVRPCDEPLSTVVTKAEHCLVTPYLTRYHGEKSEGENARVESVESPLPTVTTENRFGLVSAELTPYKIVDIQARNGAGDLYEQRDLVAPHITSFYGQSKGSSVEAPCPSPMSTVNHEALVTANLTKFYGTAVGADCGEPCPTITSTGNHLGVVTAWMAKHYGNGVTGHVLDRSLGTVTTVDHHSLCIATLGQDLTAGAQRVAVFLQKYYGTGIGQSVNKPIDTIPCVDRFGLVTVTIQGEPFVITDIGIRMLQPRELARAMGFPDSYILEGTKAEQVARIGNSVCPQVAEALVNSMLGMS